MADAFAYPPYGQLADDLPPYANLEIEVEMRDDNEYHPEWRMRSADPSWEHMRVRGPAVRRFCRLHHSFEVRITGADGALYATVGGQE